MRILLAENDDRARSALHKLLEQEPGLTLGGCSDLGELVEQMQAFRPDLLLLDWELPGRPAAALLFALNGKSAVNQVIVLSRRPEAERAVLAAGADAFVCKGDPPEKLLGVLRTVAQGRRIRVFVPDG